MDPRCHTCGYRWERQAGFSLGATTVNTIVTFGLFGLVILVGFVATYPDIATVPILVASVAIAVVVPIVFYPFSYTVWAAIDLAMRPLEPEEQAENAVALAMGDRAAERRDGPGADDGP
jgi:hypothetical protein